MTPKWQLRLSLGAIVSLALVTACAQSSAPPSTTVAPTDSTRPIPTTFPPSPQGVVVSPEFIQGAIPGAYLVLLVGLSDPSAGEVTVSATASGATVTVEPSRISGDEVAEVIVVPTAADTETEMSVAIEIEGDNVMESVARSATVHPWDDDRGDQAGEILELFTSWLAQEHPEFGVTPTSEFDGTFLAPELLVVSHYGFFNDQWEIGLSWHVMIPPDDFAEIYMRERSELRPSLAFRISSWQTALETGEYEVVEVAPPLEVVR